MVAFKSAGVALDHAVALQANTGHPQVQIRAGIHIGPTEVEKGDVFGGTVNFAAPVVSAINSADGRVPRHKHLAWKPHGETAMKGFRGEFTLWSVQKPPH